MGSDVAEEHAPLITETEYDPSFKTVIDCVVAPLDQIFPVADDEVSVTLPPWHKVVAPEAEIVGVSGNALTVITVGAEAAEAQVPLLTETE